MLDPVLGAARVRIDAAEVEQLANSNALILDSSRTRPLYFDGRFLTAADLTRDQQYVNARQADLARAGGFGVVHGLGVSIVGDGSGRRLRIDAGHGVTPAGEAVLLSAAREFDLADVASVERLDASFGLRRQPAAPLRNRSGVFVLALRPVEFSATPTASYPTSLNGTRGVQDGDIVEAVAVSLIPYNDNGVAERFDARRARIAREIFVDGSTRGIPQEALPLAMLALERGVLQWLDVFLVRREVGSESPLQQALGAPPRATREAWLLQYTQHLDAVLAARASAGQGRRFAASSYFNALPPAGPLPAEAIEIGGSADAALQYFFPASVDVELSFVPSDEIAALVEDSLHLPPLDLTATEDELDSTAVLVLVPVARPKLRELKAALSTATRTLKPAAPGLLAKRKPLELLQLVRRPLPVALPVAPAPDQAAWPQALADALAANGGRLWYLRRRNLAYRSELAGSALPLAGDDIRIESLLDARLGALKLAGTLSRLRKSATSSANAEITTLLGNARVSASDLLLQSAVNDLKLASGEDETLDQARVLALGQRYGDKKLGEGLNALTREQPALADEVKLRNAIAGSGVAPELDAQARTLSGAELARYSETVAKAAAEGPEAVRKLVERR